MLSSEIKEAVNGRLVATQFHLAGLTRAVHVMRVFGLSDIHTPTNWATGKYLPNFRRLLLLLELVCWKNQDFPVESIGFIRVTDDGLRLVSNDPDVQLPAPPSAWALDRRPWNPAFETVSELTGITELTLRFWASEKRTPVSDTAKPSRDELLHLSEIYIWHLLQYDLKEMRGVDWDEPVIDYWAVSRKPQMRYSSSLGPLPTNPLLVVRPDLEIIQRLIAGEELEPEHPDTFIPRQSVTSIRDMDTGFLDRARGGGFRDNLKEKIRRPAAAGRR